MIVHPANRRLNTVTSNPKHSVYRVTRHPFRCYQYMVNQDIHNICLVWVSL